MTVGVEQGGRCGTVPVKPANPERGAVAGPVHSGLPDPCAHGLERCPNWGCASTSDVFDRGILDDLATMLDDHELDAYLALLEPTVAPRIEKLAFQLEAGNLAGLLETAHALAGGAACYGLTALTEAARMVERAARATQKEAVHEAVTAAAGLVDASLIAVRRWRCRWGFDRAAAAHGPATA